ncbi:2',3'-cyclic-nucleotide 2'-phosphodiesterase / 3'-nucleotidase / 5'-nucleotidase [Paenibacillus barengoltzii]|uniref:5'-nucleotidase C-terminal domain-containing protein n=1 Tax=Paenibacillus barengoltzii TaxID=343517 RepID=UPI000A090740|nr:5'-nucleotidase C-terminal domain-containing protein [Paenibacillus barengoltzii]SME90785.1 2',3'-cyclic-nucleotide 2'-phosphodiesterase / 3'-nucleotidase / 5'-nucleotidase [Paenibacillus barengoltzii]
MVWRNKAVGKFLAISTLVAGLASGAVGLSVNAAESGSTAAKDFELRVLHTNDTHAHLDNIARRVTAINTARNDHTLLLDAGDVFSGTLYFNQFNGLADLFFMNELKYDAMTFGNHEFDKGPGTLAEFIKQAKFPFVSANLDFSADADLKGLSHSELGKGEPGQIYPAVIKEIAGEKVGIIGLTTPETSVLSSPGPDIKFADEVESTQKQVDALEAEGINKIVVLSHLGYTVDQQLAEAVDGIDIIVGGHSHTVLNAPEVHHADEEPTLIVQTGEYNQNLGQLDVTFDSEGKLTAWKGELIALDAKDDAGNFLIKSDAAAEAKLKEYAAPLEDLKKTVIGKTETDLDGERGSVRKQETNLGDLIADGMRSKVMSIVKVPDVKGYVTIQNGGGIRASIKAGDITLGDLLTTMPFGNNLTALKMTGAEIVAALENGVSGVENGEGRFPQVSGLRFYYDSTKPGEVIDDVTGEKTQSGQRIVKVQIQNEGGTYSDIDPKAYYIVATNSFMASGGDFYASMKQAKDDGRFYELNLVDYEVFHEYLDKVGTVKATTQGRITDLKGAPLPAEAGGTPAGPSTNPEAPAFTDISGDPNASLINEAAAAGIVEGYGDGTFRPQAEVTRAEFAVMISRAFQVSESSEDTGYTDISEVPSWALPAVSSLKKAGALEVLGKETFQPKSTLTAKQAAEAIAVLSGKKANLAGLAAEAKVTRSNLVLLIQSALK